MYVVTFYSFKGGVGRTLALLNVAYELADSGLKILVVDFDLEAPGIHAKRWNAPRRGSGLDVVGAGSDHPGIVEFVSGFLTGMQAPEVAEYIVDATPGECGGTIELMPAGRVDDSYSERLNEIDWNDLYLIHDGYVMFEDLRAQWGARGFDYVLIDSRTGFTDVGGICTRHLPDAVVTMFRPDDQSLRGMRGVVDAIRREDPTARRIHEIELHFVMAGIPDTDDEHGILEERRTAFKDAMHISAGRLLEVRHYQSMDLLTQPIYTRFRPRTSLAGQYRELTKRIRAQNIEDREGVLGYLRDARRRVVDPRDEDYLRHIHQDYAADGEVLGELAETSYSRGSILEAADLFENMARVGPLPGRHIVRLAELRRTQGDHQGAAQALKQLFLGPSSELSSGNLPGFREVFRGLRLLEAMQEDRTDFVDGSPIIGGLSYSERARVADDLDLSRRERRVAIGILEELIQGGEGSPAERASWEYDLGFARMSIGRFADARNAFEARGQSSGRASIPTAFNLAMAIWATEGAPHVGAFTRVVELFDDEEDTDWLVNSPNNLQALSVAECLTTRLPDAIRHLEESRQLILGRRNDISCWSYTRVPPAVFLAHCDEISRLFDGEDVIPEFMRLGE